jgi:hypothetical protein
MLRRSARASVRQRRSTILRIDNLERRLNRREAAEWLTTHGYRTAEATLAKLATVGGGPTYEKFGRKPLYREQSLSAWVASKTTEPRRHTSEQQAT